MPNTMTNEAYAKMEAQLQKCRETRSRLQSQQLLIDEQIEDVTRVILGLERMVGALAPAVTKRETQFKDDELPPGIMTEIEKELAIGSAA